MATEVGSVELGVKLNDNLEKDVAKVANKADSILTGRLVLRLAKFWPLQL